MKKQPLKFFLSTLAPLFLLSQPVFSAEKLLVYAAASTSQALTKIIDQYHQQNPDIQVKVSFASSSTLAKQIEAGAPAHLYISANPTWMDFLQKQGLIINKSRLNLLSNKIVLISPKDQHFNVEMRKYFNLTTPLKGKLCMGDPAHVPAGIYAKQALVSLGWWDNIKSSIVGTKDVRAALTFVERGECAAGIVYLTDARSSTKVSVLAEFPANTHKAVVYPAARLTSSPNSAAAFLTYLSSPPARIVFKQYGFERTQ